MVGIGLFLSVIHHDSPIRHILPPVGGDVTYGRVVVDYRPEKTNPYQTRLTVGGDRVNYPGDCGTHTVDLTTVKILLNRIVSTINAKFMTIDEKDFV